MNTAQQELLRLHQTHAQVNMKEIQQKIKTCKIKANRQAATCHIPKCLSCCKKKAKKDDIIRNTVDPSHKTIATRDQTHP
jgi:hypothetical protein